VLIHPYAEDVQPILFDWEGIIVDEQEVLVLVGYSSEVASKVVEAVDVLLGWEDIISIPIGHYLGETVEWLGVFAIQNRYVVEVFGGSSKELKL
jgi:uncharacterized protein involved in tolerance to divalent cations